MSDKPASPARGRKKTAPPTQQPPQEEVVVRLPLTDLHPFPDHPFQVRDDEEMRETIQSVKEYGVIVLASGDRDHILSGVFNQFLSEKSEPAE